MRLNQIIISGATNQDYRTDSESEMLYSLGKSIQVYFRQKLANELAKVIYPIIDNLIDSGVLEPDVLMDEPIDYGIRFMRRRLSPEELKEQEEEEIRERQLQIEALLSYDHSIYKKLYEVTFPRIARLIVRDGRDIDLAKDVFQSALIILLERIKSSDFELTCSAQTFLYSVSENIWRNLKKKLISRAIEVNINSYSGKTSEYIYFEEIPAAFDDVSAIIEKMGDPCKSLLECFYFQQLTWEEIAQKNGYSNAASARNQKYKCLERIRNELKNKKIAD